MLFRRISIFFLLALTSTPAFAAVFTVTNTNNTGPGSLRQAVIDANASPVLDIIDFDASFSTPRTIVVAGALTITGTQTNGLIIIGPGRDLLTLSGNNVSQIFRNTGSGEASISGLTITQGRSALGGAVYNSGSSLRLTDVRVTASTATTDGGAIFVDLGTFFCTGCIIAGNTATRNGGGIAFDAGATGTLSQTTVSSNQAMSTASPAETGGGGIFIFPTNGGIISIGNTTISDNSTPQGANGAGIFIGSGIGIQMFSTTISGNTAGGDGGGMAIGDSNVNPVNTTISGNTARNGGGVYRAAGSPFRPAGFSSSTIVNNTASIDGGGYYGATGNLGSFLASIVANNTAGGTGPDILGTVESKGYNIIRSTAGYTLTGDLTGNIHGQDPLIGPLADYGGMVRTHTLFFGSPAIDANNAQTGTSNDARGKPRLSDGDGNGSAIPDIGAFERHPGTLQFSSASYSIFEGTPPGSALITVSRTDGTDGPIAVEVSTTSGTATAGIDYTSFNGGLALSDGVMSQTFSVPILNDLAVEPDETVMLSISNPMFGAKLGSPASATLTIRDNDTPVTVSGRVTSPTGQNLRNIVVSIIDSQGMRTNATTSSFGVYSFDNLTPGQHYTITAASKRYRFAPLGLQINNSQTVDFVGLE